MSSRKEKESSASLDEIKELINSKFETLEVKLTALENKFDAVQADLQNAVRVVQNKADEAIEISKQNRDELESVNFRLAEQDRELADQDSKIRRLLDDIDDLNNWSLRKTLIFKNIPYNGNSENSWNETKNVMAAETGKVLPNTTSEAVVNFIEIAHRITSATKREGPSYLVAKIKSWNTSEELKSAFIKANQSRKSRVFVSQMYSKALTIRRNQALKLRTDLKEQDPTIQGFVRFPASLLIKRVGERKYSLERDF